MRNRTIDCKHLPKIYQGEKTFLPVQHCCKGSCKKKKKCEPLF